MKKLDRLVKFYCPSKQGNRHFDNRKLVESVATNFSAWFGGATALKGNGFWLSGIHLIKEPVTIIQAYTDAKSLDKHKTDVFGLAKEVKLTYKQDAVALEFDNALALI